MPIPPALDTAAASGPPEVRAMPASMIGYLMPSNFVNGVVRGGGDDILNGDGEGNFNRSSQRRREQ